MSEALEVKVPDIGDFDSVDIIEVLVKPGDTVEEDDSLVTLESDKASMDVPSPAAGKVKEVKVGVGDKVGEGDVIVVLEKAGGEKEEDAEEEKADEKREEAPARHSARVAQGDEAAKRKAIGEADLTAEVAVLGSGPGGYAAAFRAADLGKEVVLVERYSTLGGVCLNVGCIPSKALLHLARVVEEVEHFRRHGLVYRGPKLDLDGIRAWKESIVARLTGGLADLAKRRNVTVLQGTGRFLSPHLLEVSGGSVKKLAFSQGIVAVGSRVVMLPELPDDPRVMDSTDALELAEIPKRLLVIGGGIIGLELAGVYHSLGSRVTVVELTDGLLPGVDRDLVRPLHRSIDGRYESIYLSTRVTDVKPQKNGLKVSFEGKDAPAGAIFDRVLVAVGRRPNGDRIDAPAAGLELDANGFLPVDRQMRTNVAHLFAIGDAARPPMLAHKATHEGKVAAEVAAGERSAFDARAIPSVAYTDPEVAWVGLTETEAKQNGIDLGKGIFPWAASGRSLGLGRDEGLTKLLFDRESGRVVGAGIVGPNAGDLIAEVALAIEMGCEAEDIGLTIHPHPTLSETVAFAAEAYAGTVTDLYLPKKRS